MALEFKAQLQLCMFVIVMCFSFYPMAKNYYIKHFFFLNELNTPEITKKLN